MFISLLKPSQKSRSMKSCVLLVCHIELGQKDSQNFTIFFGHKMGSFLFENNLKNLDNMDLVVLGLFKKGNLISLGS